MKLIYTCDTINGKDVTPYTGVAEINQIIGKPTSIIGEQGYGLVYRVSVPLNTQYVNKSGISFTSNEGSRMTYAKPYTDLLKATEVIEFKCYMSFYEKLIDVINDDRKILYHIAENNGAKLYLSEMLVSKYKAYKNIRKESKGGGL